MELQSRERQFGDPPIEKNLGEFLRNVFLPVVLAYPRFLAEARTKRLMRITEKKAIAEMIRRRAPTPEIESEMSELF